MICGASTNTHLARLPFGQPNGGAAAPPYHTDWPMLSRFATSTRFTIVIITKLNPHPQIRLHYG